MSAESGKYPYIPKEYYDAVMRACKIIRETHWFNVAIDTASDEYDVDPEELKKHVRARQAAGQRYSNKTKEKIHFKYYVLYKYVTCEACFDDEGGKFVVEKGLSEATVMKRHRKHDWIETCTRDTGSAYSPLYYTSLKAGPFDTATEAETWIKYNQRKENA